MKTLLRNADRFRFPTVLLLACATVAAPLGSANAQTNAAAMAVRKRVEGLGGGPQPPPTAADRGQQPTAAAPAPTGGQPDLSFVPADAVAVAVIRPAKCLATPLAKLLPVELASAYGIQYTGFDPAKVNELVAFAQLTPEGPGTGVVARFAEPYKGSAIPASLRGAARLAKLGERNYLQAQAPGGFSFYGPDNRTLLVAPDATLRQAVESKDQPKSGPLLERALAAPPDSDVYIAVDVAALRPMIEPMIAMAQMQAQQMPAEAQQIFEIPSLITAAEFTVDVSSTTSPMSLVLHANDDAAAEKLESLVATALEMQQAQLQAQVAQTAAGNDPIAAAMARYSERVSGQWAPEREGSKLTFLQTSGEDAREKQLVLAATLGFALGRAAAAHAQVPPAAAEMPGEFPGEMPPDARSPRDDRARNR